MPVLTLPVMGILSVYRVLWRYRLFILVMTAALAGTAYFLTASKTKLYTASSLIRVQQKLNNTTDVYGALQTGERLARTYAEIATTSSVGRIVREQLPKSVPDDAINISATQVGNLELLRLSVTYSDPQIAAQVANAVPDALAKFIEETGSARDTITTIEPAGPPSSPTSPNVKLTVAIAVILGLILNGGIALLHGAVSDRIESPEELERATGHPVIATIPILRFATRPPNVAGPQNEGATVALGDRGSRSRARDG
jgi:succinoglycan biosynthesis transport protein ExoP